jgi:hypothetical protein
MTAPIDAEEAIAGPKTGTNSTEAAGVGYRKPPTKSQFKKGQSGNPRGRPKAKGNLGTQLVSALNERVRIKIGNKEKVATKEEAMLTSLVNRALQGDPKALRNLAKLADKAGCLKPEVAPKRPTGVLVRDDDGNLRPNWATPEEGRIWRAKGGDYNGKNWNGQ